MDRPDPPTDDEARDDCYATLQTRLDETTVWPSLYTFKFIMKSDLVASFVAILDGHPYTARSSAEGRHTAITADIFMDSSASVIALYRRAAKFPGVISL